MPPETRHFLNLLWIVRPDVVIAFYSYSPEYKREKVFFLKERKKLSGNQPHAGALCGRT